MAAAVEVRWRSVLAEEEEEKPERGVSKGIVVRDEDKCMRANDVPSPVRRAASFCVGCWRMRSLGGFLGVCSNRMHRYTLLLYTTSLQV